MKGNEWIVWALFALALVIWSLAWLIVLARFACVILIDCLHGWDTDTMVWTPDTERTFDGPGLAVWSADDKLPREVRVKVVRAEELERVETERDELRDDLAATQSGELQDAAEQLRERAERAEAALREIAEVVYGESTPRIKQLEIARIARAALSNEGGNDG